MQQKFEFHSHLCCIIEHGITALLAQSCLFYSRWKTVNTQVLRVLTFSPASHRLPLLGKASLAVSQPGHPSRRGQRPPEGNQRRAPGRELGKRQFTVQENKI
jgi:hypothetical protein